MPKSVGLRRRLFVALAAALLLVLPQPCWPEGSPEKPLEKSPERSPQNPPEKSPEKSNDSSPQRSAEAALLAVATHLSPPYALYLFESLSRQVLSNETLLERPDSPQSELAKDSLWALKVISKSILVQGPDGEYLDVRRVPSFFADIVRRYLNHSHFWPDREVTPQTRREHLAAWYSIYLMLLVANATQDEIARTLRGGMFERDPGMLEPGGPSLVDQLRRDGALSELAYGLVVVNRKGPAGQERLTFPAYLTEWKARISKAYGAPQ